MESVKSIVKDVVYGKSKIHTNMEFTFSNNKLCMISKDRIVLTVNLWYNFGNKNLNVVSPSPIVAGLFLSKK